jgi:hypothetical protein
MLFCTSLLAYVGAGEQKACCVHGVTRTQHTRAGMHADCFQGLQCSHDRIAAAAVNHALVPRKLAPLPWRGAQYVYAEMQSCSIKAAVHEPLLRSFLCCN